MTDQHPITPPPELVQQWFLGAKAMPVDQWVTDVATQAARWGYQQCMKLDAAWLEAKLQKTRDQELEACCEWLGQNCGRWELPAALRVARRPKPPSLKEQAHEALGKFFSNAHTQASEMTQDFEIIRRAVEALPDD